MRFSTASVMTSLVAALAVQAVPMAGVGSGALAARSAIHQARRFQFSNSIQQIEAISTLLQINGFSGNQIQNLLLSLGFQQTEVVTINFSENVLVNQFGSIFNNNVWLDIFQALSSSNVNILQIVELVESSSNSLSSLFSQNSVILEQLIEQNTLNIFGNSLRGFSEQDLILLVADLVGGNVNVLVQDLQLLQTGGIGSLSSVNLCNNGNNNGNNNNNSNNNNNNNNGNSGNVGASNSTVSATKSRKH